jgi:PIN domain nuclease of toxin-antitoxin system
VPADAPCILDACAIIAYMQDEPGADEVAQLLETQKCLIHAINLCEVYYDLLRRSRPEAADGLESLMLAGGCEIHTGVSSPLWKQAGRLKVELGRVSLADSFALAFSLQEQGILITADHHEFDPIAAAGVCPIRFIR